MKGCGIGSRPCREKGRSRKKDRRGVLVIVVDARDSLLQAFLTFAMVQLEGNSKMVRKARASTVALDQWKRLQVALPARNGRACLGRLWAAKVCTGTGFRMSPLLFFPPMWRRLTPRAHFLGALDLACGCCLQKPSKNIGSALSIRLREYT